MWLLLQERSVTLRHHHLLLQFSLQLLGIGFKSTGLQTPQNCLGSALISEGWLWTGCGGRGRWLWRLCCKALKAMQMKVEAGSPYWVTGPQPLQSPGQGWRLQCPYSLQTDLD